eukprot:jgi/Bigna1/133518/aug1.21_g8226
MEGVLSFDGNYSVDGLRLLEVTEDILQKLVEPTGKVEIRGSFTDEAVLVTNNKTYRIGSVESSNTQLLIRTLSKKEGEEDAKASCPKKRRIMKDSTNITNIASNSKRQERQQIAIEGSVTSHLALYEINPSLYKLQDMLLKYVLTDDESDAMMSGQPLDTKGLPTFDDMAVHIQASDLQVRQLLKTLNAVRINGFWRLVEERFDDELIEFTLATIEMNGWPIEGIPVQKCVEEMKADFPEALVRHALNRLSRQPPKNGSQPLDPERICVFKLELLFHKQKTIPERALMDVWEKALPYGLKPEKKMLSGYAALRKVNGSMEWIHMNHWHLPQTPSDRLRILFDIQPRWKLEELEPYMKYLKLPGDTLEALVLRYAREVNGYICPIAQ